jgi:hypothetical protein
MDPMQIAKEMGYSHPPSGARPAKPKQGGPRVTFMDSVLADAREAQLRRDPSADTSVFDMAMGVGEGDVARMSAPVADTGWAECEDDTWSTSISMLSPLEAELLSPVVEGIHTPGAISDQALLHFHREVSCELDRRLRSR